MSGPILVVGADGVIGSSLYRSLRAHEVPVIGTSRRAGSRNFLPLDLAAPPADLANYRAAVLCAGITSLAACRNDPDATRLINVENSLALAQRLASYGTFVVGLSTNLVFDGAVARRAPTDPPAPLCEYGRQKAQLESGIIAAGGAIVRLTKVLDQGTALLRNWVSDLKASTPIHAFIDMWMAPIRLGSVVAALFALLCSPRRGFFQLSASNDVSYAEAALLLCKALGADERLVFCEAAPSTIPAAERPRFTALDTARAEAELGWRTAAAQDPIGELAS